MSSRAVRLACIVALFLCLGNCARAEIVTLIPNADATLIEIAPSNSMGGVEYITAGTTQNVTRNRALMRFNIAGSIPTGSTILRATLTVTTTKQSSEAPAGSSYGVHRMLRSWGEGTNLPEEGPGLGSPASNGDATWIHRFYPTNLWAAPGGVEGTDYSGIVSSSVSIDTLSDFTFDSTFEMAGDVQSWLDEPASNFGWMLKSEIESVTFTARHFGSREFGDDTVAPRLEIEYTPPPILAISRTNGALLAFELPVQSAGTYSLEYKAGLGTNAWQTLTNFGAVTNPATLQAVDSIQGSQRFYRARME